MKEAQIHMYLCSNRHCLVGYNTEQALHNKLKCTRCKSELIPLVCNVLEAEWYMRQLRLELLRRKYLKDIE